MKTKLTASKAAVLSAVVLFTLAWLGVNIKDFISTQNGLIRLVLGTLFSVLIIIRPKPADRNQTTDNSLHSESTLPVTVTVLGVVLAITGIVFEVHQVEWLGILLLLGGGLSWATPRSYRKDIFLGLLLFYWIHPLPGVVFGSMQIFLQKTSVTLSEAFLHALNVRVWADGLVLRTGLNVYEIPSWCSGMRTATTVLILSFGLGVLKRLKWKHCIFVMILAVFQAVLLNVLRISSLVLAGPFSSDDANIDFLHDAAGIIIIAAVILVWIEISLFRRREHKSLADNLAPNTRFLQNLSELPPFWRVVIVNKGKVITFAVLIILISVAGYRHRPSHRAEMIKSVVEHLVLDRDLENAARSADAVRKLVPHDKVWLLTIIRIHIIREQYNEALALLPSVPDDEPERITEKKILKAYSYMGLNDFDAAANIITTIPDNIKMSNPMLAMIMAEVGMYSNNTDEIEKYLSIAKSWEPNIKRIRRLYPYLRTHRKWTAISNSNSTDTPYDNLTELLCAVDAYMHEHDSVSIASLAQDASERWPNDPRVLTPLFFMTLKRDNPEWEQRFSDHLKRSIASMNSPDQLYSLFGNCFKIARPDLAWAIYRRIETIDPSHPALALAAIRFGHRWFLFRKQFLGIKATSYNELTDIRHFDTPSNSPIQENNNFSDIPLKEELSSYDYVNSRKQFVSDLINEFDNQSKNLKLSTNMTKEYARILAMNGKSDKALALFYSVRDKLTNIEQKSFISEFYERERDWISVYETLHDLLSPNVLVTIHHPEPPPIPLLLRLCQAQRALQLGIASLDTAMKAFELHPQSSAVMNNLILTQMSFDSVENALNTALKETVYFDRKIQMLKARLLFDTQRYQASEDLSGSVLISPASITKATKQSIVLPPAELALQYHETITPSLSSFAAVAEKMKENTKSSGSPFTRNFLTIWLKTYNQDIVNDDSETTQQKDRLTKELIAKWSSIGRTATEKGLCLHQLAMLMCLKKDYESAKLAIDEAVKQLPSSPILWRMSISLSNGDARIIAQARKDCPDDSDIWLAALAAQVQQTDINSGSLPAIISLLSSDTIPYTGESLTRAAEFLFRKGYYEESLAMAQRAVSKANSLLPAYTIGVRTALHQNNKPFAIECVKGCISSSLSPLPAFYETFVNLKFDNLSSNTDPGIINSLKELRNQDPENRAWAEMLGYVQFIRGGDSLIDAMYHLSSAINSGSSEKAIFILAAETARQLGNLENAVAILKTGLKEHPENKTILNNLIYTLAQSENAADEALKYIPILTKHNPTDPYILDTIAFALLRNNKLNEAEDILKQILNNSSHVQEHWFRANMRRVEIAIKRNNDNKANTLLDEILKNTGGISDEDVKAANKLAERLEARRENK